MNIFFIKDIIYLGIIYMNRVAERSQDENKIKFFRASKRMFFEAKAIKLITYLLSFVPILMSFISAINSDIVFVATMASFGLTIFLEFASSFLSSHKEKAIMLNQLYEAEITGGNFSKIEYDREMTNDLNELAIRKSGLKMLEKTKNKVVVPQEIEDRYAYLYLVRQEAAKTNYLMSRMFGIYVSALVLLIILFVSLSFVKSDSKEFLQLIIQFYPVTIPIIRNISACIKTRKKCAKISADVDNFFADGDDSIERLARFSYYIQNIEFETKMGAPARYAIFPKIFAHGLRVLERGVSRRFIEAIYELKKKALILRGAVNIRTSRAEILTKKERDLAHLERLSKRQKAKNERKLIPEVNDVVEDKLEDKPVEKVEDKIKDKTKKPGPKPGSKRQTKPVKKKAPAKKPAKKAPAKKAPAKKKK